MKHNQKYYFGFFEECKNQRKKELIKSTYGFAYAGELLEQFRRSLLEDQFQILEGLTYAAFKFEGFVDDENQFNSNQLSSFLKDCKKKASCVYHKILLAAISEKVSGFQMDEEVWEFENMKDIEVFFSCSWLQYLETNDVDALVKKMARVDIANRVGDFSKDVTELDYTYIFLVVKLLKGKKKELKGNAKFFSLLYKATENVLKKAEVEAFADYGFNQFETYYLNEEYLDCTNVRQRKEKIRVRLVEYLITKTSDLTEQEKMYLSGIDFMKRFSKRIDGCINLMSYCNNIPSIPNINTCIFILNDLNCTLYAFINLDFADKRTMEICDKKYTELFLRALDEVAWKKEKEEERERMQKMICNYEEKFNCKFLSCLRSIRITQNAMKTLVDFEVIDYEKVDFSEKDYLSSGLLELSVSSVSHTDACLDVLFHVVDKHGLSVSSVSYTGAYLDILFYVVDKYGATLMKQYPTIVRRISKLPAGVMNDWEDSRKRKYFDTVRNILFYCDIIQFNPFIKSVFQIDCKSFVILSKEEWKSMMDLLVSVYPTTNMTPLIDEVFLTEEEREEKAFRKKQAQFIQERNKKICDIRKSNFSKLNIQIQCRLKDFKRYGLEKEIVERFKELIKNELGVCRMTSTCMQIIWEFFNNDFIDEEEVISLMKQLKNDIRKERSIE